MPEYTYWNTCLDFLECDEFCTTDEVLQCLNCLFKINVSKQKPRDVAKDILFSITSNRIVGQYKRFPDEGTYINLNNGVFADFLDKIAAIVTKKIDVEGDSKTQFHLRVSRAIKILNLANPRKLSSYGIFTQETFEQHYNLIWN
ncbi:hypothetical protein M0802_010093 [Mischocyttarus mexicanus]|nr:hypothetical protein M0802_010093 [Mischocyttarus mexicanus]